MTTYAEDALIKMIKNIQDAPSEKDIEESMAGICAFAIAVLRGMRGEEFVQDYLDSAKADDNAITITCTKGANFQ
jgi:hypothetical protein